MYSILFFFWANNVVFYSITLMKSNMPKFGLEFAWKNITKKTTIKLVLDTPFRVSGVFSPKFLGFAKQNNFTHTEGRVSSSSSMVGVRRGGDVVRVVVAGDSGTGKTSLVHGAPRFLHCDGVPIKIIDTSSR
jgi:hypothetical protein